MRNIALRLMYVGTAYHGWQVQKNAVTVAETLEHSLASVVGHPVKCTGAGRTDAGVHAETYICLLYTSSSSSPWAKTSRGAPEKGIRPSLITTSRSTVRATSSMEWETMMIVAFLAV